MLLNLFGKKEATESPAFFKDKVYSPHPPLLFLNLTALIHGNKLLSILI